MEIDKKEKLMKKLENHLRTTARQLIRMDTEEEALQILANSFRDKLACDFVGVVLEESSHLMMKVWSGQSESIFDMLPLQDKESASKLLTISLTDETAENDQLAGALKEAGVKTWFTVPLKDEIHSFGFCIIGFFRCVPLLDMERHFEEFGQDVAMAISMARQKEAQFKKLEGIEWVSKSLSLDSSLEDQMAELMQRAGKSTAADFACLYLYDEKEGCFEFQPPSFGKADHPQKIMVEQNYLLKEYFPFLDLAGGMQLTVPIIVDLKTIGVLHVENQRNAVFSEEDLRMLKLLGNHITTMLENTRLYKNEKDHQRQLHFLLDYQQSLVKETIQHNDFTGITSMLSGFFKGDVILFDRFIRPISYKVKEKGTLASLENEVMKNRKRTTFTVLEEATCFFSIWPISGGGDLLGYLAVQITGRELDEFDRLTIEMARNICSIQFIKQKLVLDAKEQAKDSFISRLLIDKMEDQESILQYANVFQWNIFRKHRVAVLSILLTEEEMKECNLLEQQAKKATVWDHIKVKINQQDKSILTASFNEEYILIVPLCEQKTEKELWESINKKISDAVKSSSIKSRISFGVGCKTEDITDYFTSYQQAIQALNIVKSRFQEKGYAFFEELGSYTVLHHLPHIDAVDLFIQNQLGSILAYSEEKNVDLFQTLRTFLQKNGNAKNTAESLFIHRSSLLYRLEKIESLLNVELTDSEVRFNLMMALKLFDMQGESY